MSRIGWTAVPVLLLGTFTDACEPKPPASQPKSVPTASSVATLASPGATFDPATFNSRPYVEKMLKRIGANWDKPNVKVTAFPTVKFRISRDGVLTDIELERSSGVAEADQAALKAVTASSPLPPLPSEFVGDRLGVHLTFQ